MHRTVEITTASHETERLLGELEPLKEVTGLSVSRGASIKPKGDVITMHVLNRGGPSAEEDVAPGVGHLLLDGRQGYDGMTPLGDLTPGESRLHNRLT